MTEQPIHPDVRLSDSHESVQQCPYCDRPFTSDRTHDLHLGEKHEERLGETERVQYEEASEEEEEEIFIFHIKMVILIGILWAAVVMLYMVFVS
ncbi:hypothetical protein [Halolamina sp. CBA1230]|jgi:hypothetical protein|uniref:DUF7410 domain-containing protein n=1 Tax=Halolamina sp. CBA1230 TaxID=1853690 RepID=UPI001C3C7FD6|nr:hypothetical protein [Halolamina sp. CBA1230]